MMGTLIRPELSGKNPYWIERHRYYELKHFCLQYPLWKQAYDVLDGVSGRPAEQVVSATNQCADPTAKHAIAKAYYSNRMELVEKLAKAAAPDLSEYLLKGVTQGWTYDILKARLDIPCCRNTYYDQYRKFFWLLHKERQ